MSTELVINCAPYETRVALVENGQVVELYIEREGNRSIAGNIYKGRVVRVLPGMQASFVDIGLPRAAFLHAADVYERIEGLEEMVSGQLDIEEAALTLNRTPAIEDLVRENQELLVQVAKEPIGSKGARITSHISLPGRHLVLMPTMDHVGISRRIEDELERRRLRDMLLELKPPGVGFIVRTVSEGAPQEKLKAEMDFLLKLWEDIQEKRAKAPVPSLLYRELNVILRAVRDLFTKEVDRLVVDSPEAYNEIMEFIEAFMPALKFSVGLYERLEPIFDAYGIEVELTRALGKKVWLKSGGYIVIEMTEALTVIDVNTGRYVGSRNLEETILKTNLEAVKEIAYQLRLRDIGGIIIVDFIDMEKEADRQKVLTALQTALRKDRSKTNVLPMSSLGLVEMTRKRIRGNINQVLLEPCFYCEGRGQLKSRETICFEVMRDIERRAPERVAESVLVTVHPEIADILYDEERAALEELEARIGRRIIIRANRNMHLEQYEVEDY